MTAMDARSLSVSGGVAYYLGALLGGGLLVLPSLAYDVAGPASILTWSALLVTCVPVALTFAALGARFPSSGGISTFAQEAFGDRAAAIGGYWFYFLLPFGAPPAALVGGNYLAASAGAGQGFAYASAVVLLTIAVAVNAVGLNISARVQLGLVMVLLALLTAAVLIAATHADPANLTPFAPQGLDAVPRAAALLFFAFAGWEAVTHLAGEFKDPERDLRRVALWTLTIISTLYVGLSVTSITAIGPPLAASQSPIADMMSLGLGNWGKIVTGPIAALLACVTMISFIAGASRLGASLATRGLLPAALKAGSEPGEVPRPSLAVVAGGAAIVLTVAIVAGIGPGPLMEIAGSCAAAVTALGLAAGARLLPTRAWRRIAALGAALMVIVTLSAEFYLAYPTLLAIGAITATHHRQRTTATTLR